VSYATSVQDLLGRTSPASAAHASKVGSSVTWNATARALLTAQAANPFVQVRVLTYLSLAQYNAIIAAANSKTPGSHPSAAGAAAGTDAPPCSSAFAEARGSLNDDVVLGEPFGCARTNP
jgi:hypothetical protein